jgi:SPP1 family phage portal protein
LVGVDRFGRDVIYTDVEEITADNIIDVLNTALSVHMRNRADIQYLYDYYKGKQPILQRVKDVRPEICNKIVENRANEIVSFKVGYLMGEPIQYVNRTSDEKVSEEINRLNEYMFAEDKAPKDKELAEWSHICGTSYRMVLADPTGEEDEAPFEIYTLDPRSSFVVYHSGLGNKRVMGVKYVERQDNTTIYSVYTRNKYFELSGNQLLADKIIKIEDHYLGDIPIIEYPANTARLGAFEIVLPLLDSINTTLSNRIDGIEQFVQSLLVLKGVDIEDDKFVSLKELGGIVVPPDGDVSYLVQELNQTQSQTLADSMYETILTICGMPNRNGGSSTSDTGSAVILRDGFFAAESRAKDSEMTFKKSEKIFLRLALNIMNTFRETNLKPSSVEPHFTRRNYENIQEKTQVLTTMLNNDKIHPLLAFEHCGMFADPGSAYTMSMDNYKARLAEEMKALEDFTAKKTAEDAAEASDGEEIA